MKTRVFIAAAVAAALLLAGCAKNENNQAPASSTDSAATDAPADDVTQDNTDSQPETPVDEGLSGTLAGGGASSQNAAMDAWRAGAQIANPNFTVNYDPAGSGAGRENFAQGGFAFAGTDSAFAIEEVQAGGFAPCAADSSIVELPVYISPIVVGFNLPGIDTLDLDAATIAMIFRGDIATWDAAEIAEQNPDADLPPTPVTPVHRSDKSGTTGNFTDYLAATAPDVWTDGTVEEWPAELTGEAAEKTSGVHETIVGTEGAVGYLDASQATDMGSVAIKVGDANVAFSSQGAAAAVAASPIEDGRGPNDVVVAIDRTLADPATYPLLLVSYLAACETYADPAQGQLAKALVDYVISPQGQAAAAEQAGSAPITGTDLEAKVQAAAAAVK